MSERTPKNSKIEHNTLVVLWWHTKILKPIIGNGYRFIPKGGTLPTETITLVVRSSGLWGACTQTCAKWDKKFTTTCWCRSMIACQVSWISDDFWIYLNLKTRYLNVCCWVTVAGCLTFIPISCMGPKHAPKDTYLIFSTNLYALEHVHVVQIWIMHINALKT